MIIQMFAFEWRYFTRQPSFYISAVIFFSLSFFATSFSKVETLFGSNVLVNGPFFISQIVTMLTFFSLFLVVNFVANTAMRNQSTSMEEILYCKPVNSMHYQLGRFMGAYAVVLFIVSLIPLGLLMGSLMPWVTESRVGPFKLDFYLTAFLYISVPTLFIFSCLFYAVAIRVKSMMAVYLGVIGVFVLNLISENMFLAQDSRQIAALLDPFAARTLAEVTRYWTTFEKNNSVIPLSGLILENRLIWLFVGGILMILWGRLGQSLTLSVNNQKKTKVSKSTIQTQVDSASPLNNNVNCKGSLNASWQQFISRTQFEIKQVVFAPSFIILCSFMFLIMVAVLFQPKGMFGSTDLPFTQIMVQVIRGSMIILSTIIITYYSAEVVWRERSTNIGDIIDSMPVINISFWLSKLVAVWLILGLLLAFGMGVGILFQLANGFNHLEINQYLISLGYYSFLPWMMLTVLAFLLQIISPNKYAGMFLFVLFLLSRYLMEPIGLGHHLYRFSQSPTFTYSDLNGYGWSMLSHSWYMLYWGALSVVFSILGYGLWQRGTAQNLMSRLRLVGYHIGAKGKTALTLCLIIFVMSGTNIFYQTRVLNNFLLQPEINELLANYEKKYQIFAELPAPTISKMNAAVDLFPQRRRIEAAVDIQIVNQSNLPIKRFLVAVSGYTPESFNLTIEGGELAPIDGPLNSQWFEFERPMQPGEQRSGQFNVVRQERGFKDNFATAEIIENGSFFNTTQVFPTFGYQHLSLLKDNAEREKWGLPPAERMHKIDESQFYQQTILGHSSGTMAFETTVSTSADQIAIAPGYLQKRWTEADRNYFHYKMDAPIKNYVAYLSARYEVSKSQHKGIDIEIYYHQDHAVNIERMRQSIIDSIDYYGEHFGPYQHKQARIIEFPGYSSFAQSFPNTIAFSERIGFITDMRDPDEVDQVYYVTAHEMAHQWWGGQVQAANVQGSTMIVETLAQYSALMVTKKKYGDKKLRAIIKSELDRYLRERSNESIEELPLMLVEDQSYIHYRKGSVLMMALIDLIGEERMNKALSGFLKKYRFSDNGYPTTIDLISFIRQDASPDEIRVIKSLVEEINLYDLKAINVAIKALDESQFEVSLTIDAHRLNADGQGVETEVDFSEMIDIGLFMSDPDDISDNEKPLYLQKHRIKTGENIIKLVVAERPTFAGIDPLVKLIDRDSGDNIIAL